MAFFTAVYDASVLYPAPLRDFLMWLALTDLFKARWTDEIHDEWIRNVLLNRPDLTLAQLTRTKNLMNANVRDCLVTDYESLIPALELPDPDDLHVLAAAIRSGASFIVTFNLKDFPMVALAPYGVEAIHPDEFILQLIDLNAVEVLNAANRQLSTLKNPPRTQDEYLDTLIKQGLPQSAASLRELFDEMPEILGN
ncbi:PIN domain-containing protein [Chroococcidiopsis sp. CCALA 051]|uniref:PIN domain-containing protein n=1 Tax=Chroococcidiopsis sp. CCALA 051 TaxID=869949 RepID=UPI000D0DBF89|nr:PIN domain-containing protein [Chroococcidiopsis sp. CCALA 051]PSM48491.1 PIN domain-containing protein [Chroococcidiopsis sp. CCALA 051]